MRDDSFTDPPAVSNVPGSAARQDVDDDAPPPPCRDISRRPDMWILISCLLSLIIGVTVGVIVGAISIALSTTTDALDLWAEAMTYAILSGGFSTLIAEVLLLLPSVLRRRRGPRTDHKERIHDAASRHPPR